MKRIISLLILCFMLVGCSDSKVEQTQNTQGIETSIDESGELVEEEKVELEPTKNSDEVSQKITVPDITTSDIEIIDNAINLCIVGAGYEDAKFEYEYTLNYQEDGIDLEITVIKPMNDMMNYYNTDIDGLIKNIRKSLIFDNVLGIIKESELSCDFGYLNIIFEDTPGDMYAMKGIKNE